MESLLSQIKSRRMELGLKQHDMLMKIGISRQQYQRIESKGNPRLDTLSLIAEGLQSKLMLIPKEKLEDVLAVLKGDLKSDQMNKGDDATEDPWKNLL